MGLSFKKAPDKFGQIVQLDPSMPQRGAHYLAVEKYNPEGVLVWEGYDPRRASIISDETPKMRFDAIDVLTNRVNTCLR